MLIPMIRTLDPSEPAVRIGSNRATFNAAAVRLLGLHAGGYVEFRLEQYYLDSGRKRIYVSRSLTGSNSFLLHPRKDRQTLEVSSRVLSRTLGDAMDGWGLYRICREDTTLQDGRRWYGIFFKKY